MHCLLAQKNVSFCEILPAGLLQPEVPFEATYKLGARLALIAQAFLLGHVQNPKLDMHHILK